MTTRICRLFTGATD